MPAGALGADAGLADRPQRQRGAARAGGREQPRRGGAAERDLGAGAQVEPRRGAAADEPEERDVAGEGEQLGDGGERDPARIGGQRPAERVGEHAERAAGQQHDGAGRHGEREGERRAPGDQPEVERGRAKSGTLCLDWGIHTSKYRDPAGP